MVKLLHPGEKILFNGQGKVQDGNGAWFMDMGCLHELEEGLLRFQCRIGQAHPFYIATEKSDVDTKDYDIKYSSEMNWSSFEGINVLEKPLFLTDYQKMK